MNKILAVSLLLLVWGSACCFADIIVFKNGDAENALVKEISTTEIKYVKKSRPNGPVYSVPVADIVSIVYDDGTKEMFNSNPVESSNTNISTASNYEANMKTLKEHEGEVVCVGTPTNREARACYGLCKFDEGSVLEDDNIKMELITGVCSKDCRVLNMTINMTNYSDYFKEGNFRNMNFPKEPWVFWYALKAIIHNKTSKTIYIDLANTFFKRGSMAFPYYVPSSTTDIQGSSRGIGINIAGINLGATSSSGTATTVYSQRILAVPPKSLVELTPQYLFPKNISGSAYKVRIKEYEFFYYGWDLMGIDRNDLSINICETRDYDVNSSPISFGILLSYSFEEQLSNVLTIDNTAYLARLIGLEYFKPKAHGIFYTKKAKYLSENFLNPLHFFLFIH